MQEDDQEASEGQPEQKEQSPPKSKADESQSKVGMQPPSATPIPLPPTQQQKRWRYLLGLVLGLIPLMVFLVGYGIALGTAGGPLNAIGPSLLGFFLYIVEFVVMIIFLSSKKTRFAGYGLLSAFLVTPIVVAIGCSVIPNLIHP